VANLSPLMGRTLTPALDRAPSHEWEPAPVH
jgi:hypothetical protein